MRLFLMLSISLLMINAQASALLKLDKRSQILHVITHLVYSGPDLTEEITQDVTNEISNMWNKNLAKIRIGEKFYKIQFDVDSIVTENFKIPQDQAQCAYTRVKVQNKKFQDDRSEVDDAHQNMTLYTSDNLGFSTTAAHEYGHILFLKHNTEFQLEATVPGIMFARGTIVLPQFQYDPQAKIGETNSTLNPKFRQVRPEDILAIPFSKDLKDYKTPICLAPQPTADDLEILKTIPAVSHSDVK